MLPPDHFSVSLLDDSCDKICKTFKQAWPHFLITNLNRKGTGDFIPHPSLTAQVLSSFAPEDQGLLIRNAGGGFQTAATQNLCGLEDGRSHRCLECPSMDEVRTRHPEAVSILQNDRPDWVYIPLAHSSPEVVLQRAFLKTIKVEESDLPQFDAVNKITLYTDGGAINPSDPDARLASWAVVADTSDLSVKGTQVVSEHMGSSLHCPLLKVVGCGVALPTATNLLQGGNCWLSVMHCGWLRSMTMALKPSLLLVLLTFVLLTLCCTKEMWISLIIRFVMVISLS